jgi:hypothetical protein
MATLMRPGVTLQESRRIPAPRARPSSVTGFVGLAHSGPVGSAQHLDSWELYREIFGRDPAEAGALGPSVRGFFANGGRACYAVRVENPSGGTAPSAARFELRTHAAGAAVLQFDAINPGDWGGSLRLRMSPSREHIELTRTSNEVAIGVGNLDVESTLDIAVGQALVLTSAANDRHVFRSSVNSVGPGSTIQLAEPLPFTLPAGSAVMGAALDLEIGHRNRTEFFPAVSLNPAHPRWVVALVNGEDSISSYAEKIAAGASILVRCNPVGPVPGVLPRPREGIDVPLAPTPLATLPAQALGPGLPEEIAALLRFDAAGAELHLQGHLTSRARDAFIARAPADTDWFNAITDLFNRQPFVETAPGSSGSAPTDVRLYTGFDGANYFPGSDPSVVGYSGVAALELADDVSLVAVPDLQQVTPGALIADPYLFGQQEILRHCEKMGERLAVLDAPEPPADVTDAARWLREDYAERIGAHAAAANGALFHPRLLVYPDSGDPTSPQAPIALPPSGYVAGLMARTDQLEGVHRAPANEVLEGAVALVDKIDDAGQPIYNEIDDLAHALYNSARVNVLRSIPGRGIRVLGARILARGGVDRTVPVRRTILAVKRSLRESLRWAVFEPNSNELRRRVHSAVESYLDGMFRAGVLAGAAPEEAYYVRSTEAGKPSQLVIELGFAPVEPAEFIVATIMRSADFLDVRVPA